jgi:hypothetical protein
MVMRMPPWPNASQTMSETERVREAQEELRRKLDESLALRGGKSTKELVEEANRRTAQSRDNC